MNADRMDYMAHICMIIICITPHISMSLLTAISVNVWQSDYVREYVLAYIQNYFFLFITQICLIVFFNGQINHLYDV